jgi:hypothetical protein
MRAGERVWVMKHKEIIAKKRSEKEKRLPCRSHFLLQLS